MGITVREERERKVKVNLAVLCYNGVQHFLLGNLIPITKDCVIANDY